jgi:poly(3-hydroxybutyrate) depolymerase
MLYDAYEAHRDILAPFRLFAETAHNWLDPRWLADANWMGGSAFWRSAAAALNMFSNGGIRHDRPDFGIDRVTVGGVETAVTEEAVAIDPFCRLVHFHKAEAPVQP